MACADAGVVAINRLLLEFVSSRQHNSNKSETVERRIQQIRTAVPLTNDVAVNRSCSMAALGFIRMLREVRAAIRSYDEQLETLTRQHPDFAIVDSLPGVGPVLAPRLIAVLGTQRDRFQSASELQCYSGIAPVIESSGKQSWVHWRWACPKFVRQTFQEWAAHSLTSSAWAKEYYEQQCAKGKPGSSALRSLAFKWIRILFRCWKDRTTYCEATYQGALERRRRPAINHSVVQFQWKKVAGFSTLSPRTT